MRASFSLSLEGLRPEEIAETVGELLECLAAVNRRHLRRRHLTLSSSLVRYAESEDWLDFPSVLRRGSGNCKDLSAWRVAELREAGEEATFHVIVQEGTKGHTYHVQVRRADGSVEDPSRRRGMLR